jgi:hypothetical protein
MKYTGWRQNDDLERGHAPGQHGLHVRCQLGVLDVGEGNEDTVRAAPGG